MAIVVIYIVLGILYESFTHPLTILSGLPAAGFGALLTLLIFKTESEPLRVRRHHHARRPREEERHHDGGLRDRSAARARQVAASTAIHEACLVRFRPIMMTTMAALFGTLPIALGCRRRRRSAAAARPGGGGRAARVAVAHALHHARVLRLHRGPAAAPHVSAASSPGRRAARGRAGELAGRRSRRIGELAGQAVEQRSLSAEGVSHPKHFMVDVRIALVLDRLADAGHRLHAVARVVAGRRTAGAGTRSASADRRCR